MAEECREHPQGRARQRAFWGTGSLAVIPAEQGHRDVSTPSQAAGSADPVLCRHLPWALRDPAVALVAWRRLPRTRLT